MRCRFSTAAQSLRRWAGARGARHDRSRRHARLDQQRTLASRRARRRRSSASARGRMANRRARPARARLDCRARRQPHLLPRLALLARRRRSVGAAAGGRGRAGAGARSGGLHRHRAQVAERLDPRRGQGRRHPGRALRRRAGPFAGDRRRRAQCSPARVAQARHRPAGDRPCGSRRTPVLDRNPLLARFVAEMVKVLEGYARSGVRPAARRVAAAPRLPGQAGAGAAA